jgi:hypothetical protein
VSHEGDNGCKNTATGGFAISDGKNSDTIRMEDIGVIVRKNTAIGGLGPSFKYSWLLW